MGLRPPRRRMLFVTGGSGFLGHHIVNGPATATWEIVAPSSKGLDLRNRSSIVDAVKAWRPTAIVHTAYRKGDRDSIVAASAHVADAAAACGARLVHVSTDAVFGGRRRPYEEDDRPNPVDRYGRDKLDAEREVAKRCPRAVIVRPSLLLGRSQLSAHERAVKAAIEGESSAIFYTDEVRSPGLVDDLAGALTELAARPEITGVLHLGGPFALSRAELAIMIANRYGWDATRLRVGPMGDARGTRPDHVVLDSTLARGLGLAVRGPYDW